MSYRTRKALRAVGCVLLVLVLVAAVAYLVWLLWLDRYVVYTRGGASLNFALSAEALGGEQALPPEPQETVNIVYNMGDDAVNPTTEFSRLSGYYIDSDMLTEDLDVVREQVEKLPSNTPVMLDLKNIYGFFYYTSAVGGESDAVDVAAVDELISYMRGRHMYMIARIPAFRDREYGLNHTNSGLGLPEGYLWMDGEGCYWLNPSSSGATSYLIQIVSELKSKGFREVVFSDFRFPSESGSEEIVFDGDKAEALAKAASTLVTSCASDTFAVSFETELDAFTLPEGRSRVYLRNVSAVNVSRIAEQSGFENPDVRLVFVTEATDTRFDDYSVLRHIALLLSDEPDEPDAPTDPSTPTDPSSPSDPSNPSDPSSPQTAQ